MKILFDNAAERATITSLYEDANYPPENLVDQFLELRWQENIGIYVGTITITFDTAEDINSVFLSYTNAVAAYAVTNTGAIAVPNVTGEYETTDTGEYITTDTGDKIDINEDVEDVTALYFDSTQYAVTSVTIYVFTETLPVYLGGIGIGLAYTMPDPDFNFSENYEDNSIVSRSDYGQVLQNKIDALDVDVFTFVGVTRDVKKEIETNYKSVGVGGKVWVDATEDNHDYKKPYYATIISAPTVQKDDYVYDITMRFREAR